MILDTIPEIKKLTAEEKLALSDELWQEVVGESYLATDPEVAAKLEERFREFEENPDLGVSSEEMKTRFKRNNDDG